MPVVKTLSLLLILCSLAGLASCNPCSDTLRASAKSNDGQLVANVYEGNCGATTNFTSIVNVQRTSDKFNPDEGMVFVANGRYELSVSWNGPRTLFISCGGCSRQNVFREVVAFGDIDVKYSLGPQ